VEKNGGLKKRIPNPIITLTFSRIRKLIFKKPIFTLTFSMICKLTLSAADNNSSEKKRTNKHSKKLPTQNEILRLAVYRNGGGEILR